MILRVKYPLCEILCDHDAAVWQEEGAGEEIKGTVHRNSMLSARKIYVKDNLSCQIYEKSEV